MERASQGYDGLVRSGIQLVWGVGRFIRVSHPNVISKIINHDFLMKILKNYLFLRKHTPPNVAIPHLLVYGEPMLIYLSGQKLDFKIFIHSPIIKSMFFLYNLKKACYLRKMVGKLFFFDKPALNTHTQQWLKKRTSPEIV